MKTLFLSVAVASLLSTAAFAQQPGNNGNHGQGGCGVGQQTNGCGGTPGGNNGGGGSPGGHGNPHGNPPRPHSNNFQPRNTNVQGQGQAQGQLQGQAQGQSQRSVNRNANTNNVSSVNRNVNRSTASSSSSASSRSYNAGNNQSQSYYEARDRRQAPGIAASFSSVAGNPCEGAPFGLGGSGPGFGALFQIPRESGNCWSERQAILLHGWGYQNAAVAVLSGNPVGVAIQNNPVTYYHAPRRHYRGHAVKAKY